MKTITVPKDPIAQKRLDHDLCKATELIELSLEDAIFYKLFTVGFFHSINKLTNSMIDDFEDDAIADSDLLNRVINSDLFEKSKYDPELYEIVSRIKALFIEAYNRKTGVYFYF